MITEVRLVRFKRILDHTFDVSGRYVLLAGPNNSGKTTLLHAISAWNLARQMWLLERGAEGKKRNRISIVLDEFTALPLREMNLLWRNRHTAIRKPDQKQPKPAPIYVEVTHSSGTRVQESLTMEFLYANEKLLYVKPVKSPDDPRPIDKFPKFAEDLKVVFVPAFSGIGTQEPRHSPGMQNKFVGEGKPGEIVRNLLLEIWRQSDQQSDNEPWRTFVEDIRRLFQCQLLPPMGSEERPYILCEYSPNPKSEDGEPRGRPPRLDIANAGSGFHQVLLLLSFLYSRTAALLLLDEPDAHLHVILQREVHDHLVRVAERRQSQLIISTHSEVLLDRTPPEQILSFLPQAPRRLAEGKDQQVLREAMRQVSAMDMMLLEARRSVLYVEDYTDHQLLREWSRILGHRTASFLEKAYVVTMEGRGNLERCKSHFQCLRQIDPTVRGTMIVDRDDRPLTSRSDNLPGCRLFQWKRREIENYLVHPGTIHRYLKRKHMLFAGPEISVVQEVFGKTFSSEYDYLIDDQEVIADLAGSRFLVNLFAKLSEPLEKSDLYLLAAEMLPEEIHPDVVAALDVIAESMPAETPMDELDRITLDAEGSDDEETDE